MEEIKVYSEEVREVLSRPPKSIVRWGNTMMLCFILVLLFLSWMIKYPEIIVAQSTITTNIPPQKEYAKISGKIDTVFVSNNSYVEKNTPIAIIENTANYKDILYLQSIIDTIKVNQKNFQFPMDSLPILFLGEIEESFGVFETKYSQYILDKTLRPLSNDIQTNKVSLSELRLRLHSLLSQQKLYKQELSFKSKELQRHQNLYNKGVFSEQEFENRKLQYIQAERDYENIRFNISQVRERISNAENNKKQTEINMTREEMNYLKSAIQSFNKLKETVRNWESKYVLKSDISGKVSFFNFWNNNQTIERNDLLVTIIPQNFSSYVAKLKAPVLNSGKLKEGQQVNIKLLSYPSEEYGILTGEIAAISLTPDNDGEYRIDVTLPDKLITTYGEEIDFKQEMLGTAEIITEDLRLIERFFHQFMKILER